MQGHALAPGYPLWTMWEEGTDLPTYCYPQNLDGHLQRSGTTWTGFVTLSFTAFCERSEELSKLEICQEMTDLCHPLTQPQCSLSPAPARGGAEPAKMEGQG